MAPYIESGPIIANDKPQDVTSEKTSFNPFYSNIPVVDAGDNYEYKQYRVLLIRRSLSYSLSHDLVSQPGPKSIGNL